MSRNSDTQRLKTILVTPGLSTDADPGRTVCASRAAAYARPTIGLHSSRPASTASLSIGKGDVVRIVRLPLLYLCRCAREKLSVRESDRLCSPHAFCPRRISVGRAHHHRKRMYSFRRFRTKLTFRINRLHCIA